ncbi:ribose 5-phosphate isomerase B [Crocinitomicaceae bacterium]|nr:ribose 5-phosphate isomerase B [Crocinitomicaceae bacterium]
MSKIVPIGADHAGFQLKKKIVKLLQDKGFDVQDYGCDSDASIDYPDYGHPVASMVEKNEGMLGIVICGSGNGINMTANKHQGVRSALCWNRELVALAREHNNANVLALPARFISEENALEMVEVFFTTPFEGGRHKRRVDKIPCN